MPLKRGQRTVLGVRHDLPLEQPCVDAAPQCGIERGSCGSRIVGQQCGCMTQILLGDPAQLRNARYVLPPVYSVHVIGFRKRGEPERQSLERSHCLHLSFVRGERPRVVHRIRRHDFGRGDAAGGEPAAAMPSRDVGKTFVPHVRLKLRASPCRGQQKTLSSDRDERAQRAFRGSTHVPRSPRLS